MPIPLPPVSDHGGCVEQEIQRPWYRKVYGSELPYQVLQILSDHARLGVRDVQEVSQLLEFALWEGNRPCLGVYDPTKDLLEIL